MQQHYHTIHAFFDCYGLSNARSLLSRMIKTASSEKIWAGRSPSDLLFFSEKMEELMQAAYSLVARYDYKPEVILDKDTSDTIWSLTEYEMYCGKHINYTPWDFFPRHLTKKEFLNPYKALEKFTSYYSLDKWKDVFKEILFHALSPNSIDEFDNGPGILRTYIWFHKLIEATHLIEVRTLKEDKDDRPKWQDSNKPAKEQETKDNENDESNEKLSEEEQAWNTIKEFFRTFGANDVAEELWATTKRALTNEHDETPAADRSNMIFLYEELKIFINAVNTLHQKRKMATA